MPRRIWRMGNFICIPLGNETFAYGRVVDRYIIAFYDVRTEQKLTIEQIAGSRVLFVLWINSIGCYEALGHLPLEENLVGPHLFWMQDIFTGRLSLTETGDVQTPATYEECAPWECMAVWSPEHVLERLQAHFAGRESQFAKALRLKRLPDSS